MPTTLLFGTDLKAEDRDPEQQVDESLAQWHLHPQGCQVLLCAKMAAGRPQLHPHHRKLATLPDMTTSIVRLLDSSVPVLCWSYHIL